MVERVIRVTVDPSGARSGLSAIRTSADQTTKSFDNLKGGIAAAIASLGVRELAQYADTYTLLNNRLKLVTASQAEQNRVQSELIQLANQTRSPLEGTVELYSRAARATEELGLSQRETLDITRTVNQAIQISGATAAEAAGGVIQFAQGLASGRLSGDELRSVLESMPRLARALAEGLGVGIGQLRELGAAGKLTAEQVLGALQGQSAAIQAEFDQLAPTIDSAFTILNNNVITLVGSLNDTLGTGQAFTKLLNDISGGLLGSTEQINLFGAALRTNFAERINEAVFIAKTTRVFLQVQSFAGLEIIRPQSAAELEAELRTTRGVILKEYEATAEQLDASANKRLQELISRGSDAAGVDLNQKGTKKVVPVVDDAAEKARVKTEKAAESLVKSLQAQARELELNRELGEGAAAALREFEISQLESAGASETVVGKLRDINTELTLQEELTRTAAVAKSDEDFIKTLEAELKLLRLSNEERVVAAGLAELSAQATDTQRARVTSLTSEIESLKGVQEESFAFTETIAEQTSTAIRGLIKDAFTADLDDIQATFANFLSNLGQELLTSLFLQLLADTFSNMGSSGGGTYGKIFSALGSAFGGKTGRAAGGTVGAFQPTIVGEGNRPEVFIPQQNGRIATIEQLTSGNKGSEYGLEAMVARLISVTESKNTSVVNINEQDPDALLSVMRTRSGVAENRNFVNADKRKISRTLGIR
jgi:tape measure domain-containing protein